MYKGHPAYYCYVCALNFYLKKIHKSYGGQGDERILRSAIDILFVNLFFIFLYLKKKSSEDKATNEYYEVRLTRTMTGSAR